MQQRLHTYLSLQQIDAEPLMQRMDTIYRPLAEWLRLQCENSSQPIVVGINGAQGTGKSTLATLLKILLKESCALESIVLSLDDYYLSQEQRAVLAGSVHPLLKTRGVPGTHTIDQLNDQLEQLIELQPGKQIELSRFDKATDDVSPAEVWKCPQQGLDLILLEGWCVGATPQTEQQLEAPVNRLEHERDSDGRWRTFVNQKLKGSYQVLNSRLDFLLMLLTPDFESVVEWRKLQESKLRALNPDYGMKAGELRAFMEYFQRLTEFMRTEMPQRADVVLAVAENHQVESMVPNLQSVKYSRGEEL